MSCLFIIQKECCCGCVCEGGFQRQRKTTGGFLDTVHTNRLHISISYPRSYRYEGTQLEAKKHYVTFFAFANAKKQATKVASPEVDLSSPQHSQSILWGHASRETLSSDESTTQWIDGSVTRKAFMTPTSKISGKGKTPRSTYHERVEQSYSKPVLTPGRKAKSTTKSSAAKTRSGQRRAISKSKTPTVSKRTKSSTKKVKKKSVKKSRAKSPQKHNFNNLKHISKGAYTDSASNLRWARASYPRSVTKSNTCKYK